MNRTISSENILEATLLLNGIDTLRNVNKDFYYDETNNYRKVHLRNGKLNIDGDGDFALGGIVVNKGIVFDLTDLYKEVRLDKTANEMKFKHIAHGNFLEILTSKKLKTILKFLLKNNIEIHFQRINIFYWAVLDIVESVITEYQYEYLLLNHLNIKDRFYRILEQKKDDTLYLMNEFSYPDIESEKLSLFYKKLLNIIQPRTDACNGIDRLLIHVLELGSKLNKAIFIQNEDRNILIDDFSPFYRHRILMFPNSYHYFDTEKQIEDNLLKIKNSFNNADLDNYCFIPDSKHNPMIQLSDVIIGYVAKLFNFCKGRTSAELQSFRQTLSTNQLEILKLSRALIDKSDATNPAYFHHIIPISDGPTWAEFAY